MRLALSPPREFAARACQSLRDVGEFGDREREAVPRAIIE